MGVVSLALRDADGLLVALKTVQPGTVSTQADPPSGSSARRGSLGELDHPHIVAFHEVGESKGLLYFAMNFVAAAPTPPNSRRSTQAPYRFLARSTWPARCCRRREYAHAKGFVHRDIKPANLLVEEKAGRDVCARPISAWRGPIRRRR